MLQKLSKNRGGFTLVEIMIVVAIIALLAAIAVPNFLRARKRSQATRILEDMRMIDGAKDQYAIENNLAGNDTVSAAQLAPFVKQGTPLAGKLAGNDNTDLIGGAITLGNIDTLPVISMGPHITTSVMSCRMISGYLMLRKRESI